MLDARSLSPVFGGPTEGEPVTEGSALTPTTEFLNVDLEVRSRRSLAPLLEVWPSAQTPGRTPGRAPRWVLISGVSYKSSADRLARELIALVDKLPPRARRCWSQSSSRVFDIGIQAGLAPRNFEGVRLATDVLRAMARLKIRLVITVYAPSRE
jgi:hypothetical protein